MAKDKNEDDDQPRNKKKEPAKSNLGIILALVGCGGFLLLGCVASAGVGYWLYSRSNAPKDGAAQKGDKKDAAKDKDGADKKGASKLRRDYDQVQMGDHIRVVETLMGGRGFIGSEGIPRLTDKTLGMTIGKNIRLYNVNVIRSWENRETGETLVIGLQEDVVGFKGYYYRVGAETRVEHQFTNKK